MAEACKRLVQKMGEVLPNTGVKHDDRKREAVHQVQTNQTHQPI
jgi:hypothetical protein